MSSNSKEIENEIERARQWFNKMIDKYFEKIENDVEKICILSWFWTRARIASVKEYINVCKDNVKNAIIDSLAISIDKT